MSLSLSLPPSTLDQTSLSMPPLITRVLHTREEIAQRVRELGQAITADYAPVGRQLVAFGILKGVLPFQADLIREIDLPLQVDVMTIAGYRPGHTPGILPRTPGVVRITKDLDLPVTGRHVLIIEDMVDTGLTLNFISKMIRQRRPASIAIATLFNREANRLVTNLPVRYIGFEAPAEFLVGYGLDFHEKFRNLPYVGILKTEAYS